MKKLSALEARAMANNIDTDCGMDIIFKAITEVAEKGGYSIETQLTKQQISILDSLGYYLTCIQDWHNERVQMYPTKSSKVLYNIEWNTRNRSIKELRDGTILNDF